MTLHWSISFCVRVEERVVDIEKRGLHNAESEKKKKKTKKGLYLTRFLVVHIQPDLEVVVSALRFPAHGNVDTKHNLVDGPLLADGSKENLLPEGRCLCLAVLRLLRVEEADQHPASVGEVLVLCRGVWKGKGRDDVVGREKGRRRHTSQLG